MTVCNMSIEAGARAGMIAPDDDDVRLPEGPAARAAGRGLGRAPWPLAARCAPTPGASFDREVRLDAGDARADDHLRHQPGHGRRRSAARVPERPGDAVFAQGARLHGPRPPASRCADKPVEVVFIGSCTNARLSDLRAAAAMLRGRKVAPGVRMLVVPGLAADQARSRSRGPRTRSSRDAGAEWRESGCSMCLGMNGDTVDAGQYCVSTSNRNFEGRQGIGRAHPAREPADRRGRRRARPRHRSARIPR